jgi:hypothetical protein
MRSTRRPISACRKCRDEPRPEWMPDASYACTSTARRAMPRNGRRKTGSRWAANWRRCHPAALGLAERKGGSRRWPPACRMRACCPSCRWPMPSCWRASGTGGRRRYGPGAHRRGLRAADGGNLCRFAALEDGRQLVAAHHQPGRQGAAGRAGSAGCGRRLLAMADSTFNHYATSLFPAWWLALPWCWRGCGCAAARSRLPPALGRAPGLYPRQAAPAPDTIWVHAVSVGETRAAEPLVDALLANGPTAASSSPT